MGYQQNVLVHAKASRRFYTGHLLVARRATYVVDGRFFCHFFWKVEGTVRTHVNSRVARMWLQFTVINVQDVGGDSELCKTRKVRKTSNFYKHGGEHW